MASGLFILTSELIRLAFPEGVSEEEYPALIWVLDDAGMSIRSIATALAESGTRDKDSAYNDVLGVLSEREAYAAQSGRIIEKMRPHGYDDWRAGIDIPLSQIHMMRALDSMRSALDEAGEKAGRRLISNILKLDYGSEEFWRAVTSLDIWGGSGSLLDQALVQASPPLKGKFHRLLLALGDLIEKEGRSTPFVRSANIVLREMVRSAS